MKTYKRSRDPRGEMEQADRGVLLALSWLGSSTSPGELPPRAGTLTSVHSAPPDLSHGVPASAPGVQESPAQPMGEEGRARCKSMLERLEIHFRRIFTIFEILTKQGLYIVLGTLILKEQGCWLINSLNAQVLILFKLIELVFQWDRKGKEFPFSLCSFSSLLPGCLIKQQNQNMLIIRGYTYLNLFHGHPLIVGKELACP